MAHRLSRVGNRFNMKFYLVNGTEFMGQITSIPDTSRVTNFLSTRRYLRTHPDITNVVPSDVMISEGLKFIIAEHGVGYYRQAIYKHFKMFEVTHELAWYTLSEAKDAVTGVMKKTMVAQPSPLYLSMQPKASTEDQLNIQNQNYTAVCNKPVKKNDIIGNMVVTKVDDVLGCWLIEMKDK